MKQAKPSKRQIIMFTFVFALMALYPIQAANSQASSGTVVNVVPQMSTAIAGETVTVNITISNVQNLYGLDVTLDWNTSVLQVLNVNSRLGVEAYPDGILYGNHLNYDAGSVVPGDILVKENSTSQEIGEYHLAAACVGFGDSFNGSGNIVILAFKVITVGHSGLVLQSDLADRPVTGETTSSPIDHTDLSGSVDAVIPEFPSIATVAVLLVLGTVALLFSRKALKKSPDQEPTHSPALRF
jgi:hypothetical protein